MSSLVVVTPGPTKTSSSIDGRSGRRPSGSTRAPIVTSLSTALPRPTTVAGADHGALAHVGLVADDRAVADHAPAHEHARRKTSRRRRSERRGRPRDAASGGQARRLAEQAPSSITAAVADHGAGVDHDVAADPTPSPSTTPSPRPGRAARSRRRQHGRATRRRDSSSDAAGLEHAHDAQAALAVGARRAALAHAVDEVLALEPQRLVVGDPRADQMSPERVMYSP